MKYTALKLHYALAKSDMKRKQVYRLDHTTSTGQLICDEYIVNQYLGTSVSRQTNNFLSFAK